MTVVQHGSEAWVLIPEKLATDCFGYPTDLSYLEQQAVEIIWLNPSFYGYSERKIEMTRVCSADEG